MMSSSYPTSYPRIDHRTVFKSLQLEPNCVKSKETLIADIFSPITELTQQPSFSTPSPVDSHISQRPSLLASHSTKSKIPYPLTTIWTNKSTFYIKRNNGGGGGGNVNGSTLCIGSDSVRRRGSKSNLPLIMEPVTNETAMKVECTHRDTPDSSTTTAKSVITGGRFYTTRRKLALNTQKPSTDPLLKRSLSLRKNFKYSTKTDSPAEKLATPSCAATNIKSSSSVHDVTQTTKDGHKDQGDGPSMTKNMEQLSPDAIVNGKISREFRKMSLNQNGLHSSSAATTPTTTTTTTAASHYPHSRPSTLATSAPNTTGSSVSGIPKSPKSPRISNAVSITGNNLQQNHNHHQQHHQSHSHSQSNTHQQQQQNTRISPGLKSTPKTPPVTPDSPSTYLDDDLDSLYSYTTTSGRSTMSCEHPYVARNGTTFSGRKMKYVVHCSNYAGQVGADYLTPTQRAQRQIRRLKELLCVARQDLEHKDSELLRLTREVVELRLFKASLSSPDERSASSDAVTVREAELKTSQDVSPIIDMVDDAQKPSSSTSPSRHIHGHHHGHGHGHSSASPTAMIHPSHMSQSSSHHHHHHVMHDMQSSFADSGHFEDMTSSSVHSKDSAYAPSTSHVHHDQACGSGVVGSGVHHDEASSASTIEQYELQRQELIRMYEQRIEDLVRSQDAIATDIKRSNNDRIEALLQKLAECNTRYADIVPDYEHAKERIRELEKLLEDLQRKLSEHEEKQKQMYLHMYQKGQEAERIARADQALELAHRAPQNKVSINELLHQLQSTQDELENIRAAECRNECGSNHALLTAKEAISLWVLGARKTIYRRLLEAQKNRTHVDPEVTLQFLKSAVYYFLTDKENSQGHLQAIESILEFSEAEKQIINKARATK